MADQAQPSSAPEIKTNVDAHKLVTKANVSAALAKDKGPEATLNSFQVIDFIAVGDNYACFVSSVEVTYHELSSPETQSVTYVVKLNPCRKVAWFDLMTNKIFSKEAQFYSIVVPQLNACLQKIGQPPLRFPQCYYTSFESLKEIIFLEDMRKRNFNMFDRKKGLDENHVILVVEELGRLHAASVMLQEDIHPEEILEKYPFLADFFIDTGNSVDEMKPIFMSFAETGAQIAEKLEGYDKVAAFLREMAPSVMEKLKEQCQVTPKFKVLCHGDCWNNNLLFRSVCKCGKTTKGLLALTNKAAFMEVEG